MNFQKGNFRIYAIALGVIILIEVFVCNYLFFRNIWNWEIPLRLQQETGEKITLNGITLTEDGSLRVEDESDPYIEIHDLNLEGRDLYLGLTGIWWTNAADDTAMDFYIETVDESHREYYNRGGSKTVSTDIEQTKYISLRPMGQLKSIRITPVNVVNDDVFQMDYIIVNARRPLFFSIVRVILFFLIFLMIYHLRSESEIYEIAYNDKSNRQKIITLVFMIFMLVTCFHMSGYLKEGATIWSDHNPYDYLAHSMADGRVDLDIDMPADSTLLEAVDPYVPDMREGITYTWDCTYYEGKYYVYYGVVPEILFYLPHYLLTGEDFGVLPVGRLELMLFIVGIFFCFLELGRRFNERIPYVIWLLLFAASAGGLQLVLLSRCILFYHIPVIMGCALLAWGFWFWISSEKEGGKKYSFVRIMAGSLCMALSAGCRPHMIFGSLTAIPIFGRYFFLNSGKERKRSETVKYMTAGALPFILVLGLLFFYNAVRFGSPLEFGARYNLTAIDVTRVDANPGKVIPGLFWYLLAPPKITPVFPFIENVEFTSSYTGDFFALYSNGGFLICNPLTVFLLAGLKRKDLFEDIYQKGFFYICLAVSILIMGINMMMGGFMTRYYSDFSPFIHLALLPVICLMIDKSDERARKQLLPAISFLCVITVFYHILTYYIGDGGSDFSLYDRQVFLRAAQVLQWWE